MNDMNSARAPIGLWAMIALALILSVTSIILHITLVSGRNYSGDYASPEYQQMLTMNQQLRGEITRLQDAINNSTSFSQLKKSLKQVDQRAESSVAVLTGKADSPFAALIVLEQSQRRGSFEPYREIHPDKQNKVLDEISSANKELTRIYQDLEATLSTRFGDIPSDLEEADTERQRRLLFGLWKQYDVLETTYLGEDKAELKVTVKVEDTSSVAGTGPKSRNIECKLQAFRVGDNWKISDYPEATDRHQQVLTWLKQRVKDVQAINQRCKANEFKQYTDFVKVWEALPKEK